MKLDGADERSEELACERSETGEEIGNLNET